MDWKSNIWEKWHPLFTLALFILENLCLQSNLPHSLYSRRVRCKNMTHIFCGAPTSIFSELAREFMLSKHTSVRIGGTVGIKTPFIVAKREQIRFRLFCSLNIKNIPMRHTNRWPRANIPNLVMKDTGRSECWTSRFDAKRTLNVLANCHHWQLRLTS